MTRTALLRRLSAGLRRLALDIEADAELVAAKQAAAAKPKVSRADRFGAGPGGTRSLR
ncbi:hypothetical protein ACFXDE_34375 [Kitasatospora sp. NPDC059408]|uniref:hypothetical protein n=1 Tax=Kitasatospora sp. NPDC059408 TaxID=3346823 RepID=UPI0036A7F8AB